MRERVSSASQRQQQRFARAAIDAGASLVVGHHPHVTQPVEVYRDGIIFYSLGNLVFDQFQRKDTQRGWIADVRFTGPRNRRLRRHPGRYRQNGSKKIHEHRIK